MHFWPKPWFCRLPATWWEWVLWGGWGAALLLGAWRWGRGRLLGREGRAKGLLLALAVAAPLLSVWGYAPPSSGGVGGKASLVWVPLGALAWGLAAGWLGERPAVGLALITGWVRAMAWTHSCFTPWSEATLALAVAWAAQQPYRTRLYRALRHPWGSVLFGGAVAAALSLGPWLGQMIWGWPGGEGVPTYDGLQVGFRLAELLLVALVALGVEWAWGWPWGRPEAEAQEPSPMERSLAGRFMGLFVPLALLVAAAMALVSVWVVHRTMRGLLESRLNMVADLASRSVPLFVEQGQQWIARLAHEPQWAHTAPEEAGQRLQDAFLQSAAFTQLLLVNPDGEVVAGYPRSTYPALSPDESKALPFALAGAPAQVVPSPAEAWEEEGWVSFVAPVPHTSWVLIGRSDLATTSLTEPLIRTLDSLQPLGGVGMLLDDQGRVLYPSAVSQPPVSFQPEVWQGHQARIQEVVGLDGRPQWMLVRRTAGRPWWILTLLPVSQVYRLSLHMVAPLVAVVLVLYGLSLLGLRSLLRMITSSLSGLAVEAQRIARGDLDHALKGGGVDEVGQLRQAFEQMRQSLQARLTELRQLLEVSRHTARTQEEVDRLVQPVLQAALKVHPEAARIVLLPSALPAEGRSPQQEAFGAGKRAHTWAALDARVASLMQQRERLVLPVAQVWDAHEDLAEPPLESVVALALRHERRLFGVLYVVFPAGRKVDQAMLDYLTILAGQLSVALANVRLFLETQLEKRRLEAILASLPDPILVTDGQDRLILANPSAREALGIAPEQLGRPVSEVVTVPKLVDLLLKPGAGPRSEEILLEDGRVYFALVSDVRCEGGWMGRVSLLRDITFYKELDALKSEFVATVSHDLRSPLTLVRGYATMLDLTASLDERHRQYVKQILQAVDNMAHLVNNLLDLGRIEAGVKLQLGRVAVEGLLQRVASSLEPKAQAKGIHLGIDLAPDVPSKVEADEGLLERALINLVDNAIKYTPPEGRVTLRAQAHNGFLRLAVEDTGVGIAPVDQPRLFEKFFRVQRRDVQREQGSGLGLAIVKSIVDRHHGRVWVESQLGKGSVFIIELPLRQPAEGTSAPDLDTP